MLFNVWFLSPTFSNNFHQPVYKFHPNYFFIFVKIAILIFYLFFFVSSSLFVLSNFFVFFFHFLFLSFLIHSFHHEFYKCIFRFNVRKTLSNHKLSIFIYFIAHISVCYILSFFFFSFFFLFRFLLFLFFLLLLIIYEICLRKNKIFWLDHMYTPTHRYKNIELHMFSTHTCA